MKKTTLLFLAIFALTITGIAQDIIFKETFGTPSTPKGENIINHVWDNLAATGITYSWTRVDPFGTDTVGSINVRSNNPSDSLAIKGVATASGHGNLYFNSNATNSFTISGISGISGQSYDRYTLSFGIFGKNAGDSKKMVVQYSNNGGELTNLAVADIAALASAKGKWEFISGVIVPASNNLSVKFSTPTLGEIRIDDVILFGELSTAVNNLNPENRKLTVSNATMTLKGFTTGNVEIYNIQGKRVFTSELKETIQPQLSKGLYIVRIGDFRQKISL